MNYEETEALNLKIELKTEEVTAKILNQNFVKVGDDLYHIDNFIADVQINTYDFVYFLRGADEDLSDDMNKKFLAWCEEIAVKLIKQGE